MKLIRSPFVAAGILTCLVLSATQPSAAEPFKKPSQCVAGARVTDGLGKSGTVVGIPRGETVMCAVRYDDGEQHTLLFWMLRPAGSSKETNDQLVAGTYECFANNRYTFMDVRITGPGRYFTAGASGTYKLLPSRDIVFVSGPLKKDHGHLLAGPSIGLNADGGSFYATNCDLKK